MNKILIVDDAAFMRMMIKDNLKNRDTEFIEAGDGEDAVAKYKENKPALVLMDITCRLWMGFKLYAD